ncbi:large ribosomal subunit protein bL36m isoform X2 [Phyllopteryx taeniolatus]|uniref:large ribosomal subunit protein bL36m isoform X2 n=1 Tax=Phyllopteryx taeniolatus TaxID=161469 RepID=UPI002AD583C8|nr:large ribosomal subunit protein bL36m isoform X2 [Phyllopteryx taeniolatus]
MRWWERCLPWHFHLVKSVLTEWPLTSCSTWLLSAAPRLPSSASVSGIQPAACGPSLLGQCRHLPSIQPADGMKTKSALRRRCKDCFFVRRRGRLFVFCKTNPRHKQRQG